MATERVYHPETCEPFDVIPSKAQTLVLEKGWSRTPWTRVEVPAVIESTVEDLMVDEVEDEDEDVDTDPAADLELEAEPEAQPARGRGRGRGRRDAEEDAAPSWRS